MEVDPAGPSIRALRWPAAHRGPSARYLLTWALSGVWAALLFVIARVWLTGDLAVTDRARAATAHPDGRLEIDGHLGTAISAETIRPGSALAFHRLHRDSTGGPYREGGPEVWVARSGTHAERSISLARALAGIDVALLGLTLIGMAACIFVYTLP